jgi:hypothetical protein
LSDTGPPSDDGNADDRSANHNHDKAAVVGARKVSGSATRRLPQPTQSRPNRKEPSLGFWANVGANFGSTNQILATIVIGLVICMVAGAVGAVLAHDSDFFTNVIKTIGALLSPIIAFAIGRSSVGNRPGHG